MMYFRDNSSFHVSLLCIAFILLALGSVFIIQAFFSKKSQTTKVHIHGHKSFILKGCIGLMLLWCSGVVVIYFYNLLPKENNSENNHKDDPAELPDISLDNLGRESRA